MKVLKPASAALVALSFAGILSGCGGNSTPADNSATTDNSSAPTTTDNSATNTATTSTTSGSTDQLNGAGATFPYPLYSKWFDEYKTAKSVQINYQAVGSGAGIKQMQAKTVDFGASDAPVGAKDAATMSPFVQLPTVAGAVVLAYNVPGAPAHLKLTGDAIANIFLGKIKKWSDPAITSANPGAKLPDTNITVAHRSDGSGTTNIFTNYLASASNEWKTTIGAGKTVDWPTGQGGKGNDGVAAIVKQAPGGFGYVELAYAKKNSLAYASVKNAAGQFIEPTVDATTAAAVGALPAVTKDITAPIANAPGAKSYPISGFTYLLVYKQASDPAKGAALKDFLTWAMADGQKDAAALDYAPLPKEVIALNTKAIDTLK